MAKKLNVEIQILATQENGAIMSRIKTAASPGMKIEQRTPMVIQALISSFVELVNMNLDASGSIIAYNDAKKFIDLAIARAEQKKLSEKNPKLNLN